MAHFSRKNSEKPAKKDKLEKVVKKQKKEFLVDKNKGRIFQES